MSGNHTEEDRKTIDNLTREMERLRLELEKKEQRLHAILNGTKDAILYVKNSGKVVEANQAFSEVTGIKREEVIGASSYVLARNFLKPKLLPSMLLLIPKVLSGGQLLPFEIEYADPSTNEEKTLDIGVPSNTGSDGITVIIRDVTARKRIADSLEKINAKYRLLSDNSEDVVWIRDKYSKITYVSPSIERQRGYTVEEFTNLEPAYVIPESALAELSKHNDSGTDGDTPTQHSVSVEVQVRCKDGTLIWNETTLTGIKDEDGNSFEILGVSRDISEKKNAEMENYELQEQLRHSQKMEAIGRLAGGVAHDMNNVLGAIMGSAAAMQSDDPGGEFGLDVQNILDACDKGSKLTKNLLGFARKGKYIKARTSFNEVVANIELLLRRMLPQNVSLIKKLHSNLKCFEGDAAQIEHALMNVCINALDAIKNSGTLTISTRNIKVESNSSGMFESGEYVCLEVSDTGEGMDKSVLNMVFEPFFTTKPKEKGTGLGLSMVYGTIKNHGGRVNISSEPGQGTTVTFVIPAVKGFLAKSKIRKNNSTPPSSLEKGTVLLVDDEETVLRSSERLLRQIGFKVLVARNGLEALDIYKQQQSKITLVVLDLIMPKIDGIETLRRLKEINPKIRVLLCSGYSKDKKLETQLDVGKVGFLQKPFNMIQFNAEITKILK